MNLSITAQILIHDENNSKFCVEALEGDKLSEGKSFGNMLLTLA
jgi:hypothetical protein